jgi:type IV pilus assembly protein PilV
MVTTVPHSSLVSQRGTSMLEVLVTLVILAIGLLGLAGLQSRLQASEMEAYQRAQALILLDDMASRIATNRGNAIQYVTGTASPLGAGMACPTDTSSRQDIDASEWCLALQGAAEASGGARVGAMLGGRGCVESLGGSAYRVTVAWQGLTPIASPAVACGKDGYDTAGSACTADLCRRAITTIVRIGKLS